MCSMIGMETGSRAYLKYRTVVRIHKRLPCKCSVHEFTHDTNVGFPPVSYCVYQLASFPCTPPVLITRSMQIQRGKAWEIWSCVVMSGRGGAVPDEESPSHFLYYQSESGGQSVSKAA